jgi:hypothetical protein
MLILDNFSAHPNAELFVKDNVLAVYLPPNCTSLVQPLDQGILWSFKSHYKGVFLCKMMTDFNKCARVKRFQSNFNIKDTIWSAAKA